MFNQKYLSARDTVIKHETLQNNNDKDISLKANLEVIKNNAVLNPSSDNINQVINAIIIALIKFKIFLHRCF